MQEIVLAQDNFLHLSQSTGKTGMVEEGGGGSAKTQKFGQSRGNRGFCLGTGFP